MNDCTEMSDQLEYSTKIDVNKDCDFKCRNKDLKNCSGSQDMFSDEDQVKDYVHTTPNVRKKNDTLNSSIISLKTPILYANIEDTPGKPKVPKTPVDLLPFIRKTSLLWTSDMETPESKPNKKSDSCDRTINEDDNKLNTTPNRKQCTSPTDDIKVKKMDVTSPVLGGNKRNKKRVKRRILNSLAFDSDNNNDQQSSISSNSDKVTIDDIPQNIDIDINKPKICNNVVKQLSNIEDEGYKQNKKLEDAVIFDKNSNTSTQEFFSNASFTLVDRLCSSIHEEKSDLNGDDPEINKVKEEIISDKEKKQIDNDVLHKVATIRRNQKRLRRASEINHSVVPKEDFAKSIRELELADTYFSQENKKEAGAHTKPLKSMTFTKLSSIENGFNLNNELKNLEFNTNHDIPTQIDDWNACKLLNGDFNKENLCNDLNKHSTINENNNLNGNDALISSEVDHIQKCIKLEVDDQINRIKSLETISDQGKRSETLKLYHDLDLEEFLEPKFSPENVVDENASATLNVEQIQIKDEKPIDTLNLLEELIEKEANGIVKNKTGVLEQPNVKKEIQLTMLTEEIISDGFTTASGKNIKINEDKEKYYLKLYSELEDIDDSLLNKKNTLKSSSVEKSKNGTLIISNENDSKLNSNICTPNIKIKTDMSGTSEIKTSNKKENDYSKILSELKKADDNSLPKIKKKNTSRLSLYEKPKDKTIIEFKKPEIKPDIKVKKETSNSSLISDGFSTASGTRIQISEEKENYYAKIYDELKDNDENSLIKIKQNNTSKLNLINQPKSDSNVSSETNLNFNKKDLTSDNKEIENITSGVKLSISSDGDDVLYNLSGFENLIGVTNEHDAIKDKQNENKIYTHEVSGVASINDNIKSGTLKEVILHQTNANIISHIETVKLNTNLLKDLQEKNLSRDILKNNECINHIGLLKRKLENCDVKRPERCRSFGGFSAENENTIPLKLNKSDPNNESLMNQPLQTCLSVSQCFDSHSDSWLSKVEISFLNSSKLKSPNVKFKKPETIIKDTFQISSNDSKKDTDHFLGFTFKECTESFRHYSKFKNYLDKLDIKSDNNNAVLEVQCGQTISISNQTLSSQKLCISPNQHVGIRKGVKESNYVLIDYKATVNISKIPLSCQSEVKKEESKLESIDIITAGKRKHADTDSDTPLSTLKKPRVGSELQGRKLFSDGSDDESNEANNIKPIKIEEALTSTVEQQTHIESEEDDLSDLRIQALLQQEKLIRNKKRMKIKPLMGSLLRERLVNSKNRLSWVDLVGETRPVSRTFNQIKECHPDAKILEVTASNATCYKFLLSNIIGNKKVVSIDVGDGAKLIFDEHGRAGVTEFSEAFLAMPGIDPKLLPTGWIENHYKWIVWKFASMDRIHFKSFQLPKMLTPERVMKELKYRYDREIDKSQRPALRKILEKDDVPSRRLVLCISSIQENTNPDDADKEAKIMLGLPRWKIEATDGWYSIPLTIDNAMSSYITSGKIKEGMKIVTYGAELLECERGFYPLEKPANVSLKIYTNSTRRARWDTKLGYHKISRPIPVKLRNIIPTGGLIGETTAVAARVYPLLYREKTVDGQSIYRNARAEEKAAVAHERALESKVQAIYAEAEKQFDSKKNSDDEDQESLQNLTKLQGEKHKQNNWEKNQEEIKQKLELEVRNGLPPLRKVTTVLRVRLVDDSTTVTLTIWGADDDSSSHFKEGSTITVYNSFPMGSRGGELNLTANKMSHIKKETLLKLPYPQRSCTLIYEMMNPGFEPKFCEFDTVGVVVSLGCAPYGLKNFEMIILAYPKPNDSGSSYIAILFWNGISSFGYQGMLTVGSMVACSNIEWRRNTVWSIAVGYCSEKTMFTCNPRQSYLNQELRKLKAMIQNPMVYADSCAEEVANELSKKIQPRSSQNNTPTSWTRKPSFINSMISPMDNYNPSNLAVQRRLDKLSRYANSAPDVSPIVLNDGSARVKKSFTPVTRNNT